MGVEYGAHNILASVLNNFDYFVDAGDVKTANGDKRIGRATLCDRAAPISGAVVVAGTEMSERCFS
jgi:hypothetical protein